MKNGRLAQLFQQALVGRYGSDRLGRFLSLSSVGLLILSVLSRSFFSARLASFLSTFGVALLCLCYFRMFSRSFERREEENQRFLEAEWALRDWLHLRRDRYEQRKEYAFFTCPGCKQLVRVPKNKGRIRITCRRCGYSFEKKT